MMDKKTTSSKKHSSQHTYNNKERKKHAQNIVEKVWPSAALSSAVDAGNAAVGKKSAQSDWITTHKLGILITLGILWGAGEIIKYYYPDEKISEILKAFSAFFPIVLSVAAFVYYLLFPYLKNRFYPNKKN